MKSLPAVHARVNPSHTMSLSFPGPETQDFVLCLNAPLYDRHIKLTKINKEKNTGAKPIKMKTYDKVL